MTGLSHSIFPWSTRVPSANTVNALLELGARLAGAAEGEERLRGARELLLEIAEAVALRVDDLAVHHDAEPESHHLPRGHGGIHEAVEALERLPRGIGTGGGGRLGARLGGEC